AEPELGLSVVALQEWKIWNAVWDHLDLLGRHAMHGPEQLAAFFCHHDQLGRPGNNLSHDIALSRRRHREHGMQSRYDRHGELPQELDDWPSSFAAKNPVLVLKGDNIESRSVQRIGGFCISIDCLLLDLEAHSRWIVIRADGVVHSHHPGP